MVNPTGLINTDLMILDIVASNISNKLLLNEWKDIENSRGSNHFL